MLHKVFLNSYRDMKLRTKLLISYLFVVLLPVVLVGYFLISRTTDTVLNQTDYNNRISFHQMKNNIYDQLTDYLDLSNTVLLEKLLNDYINTEYDPSTPYFDKYMDFLKVTGTYTGILQVKVRESANVSIFTSNHSILTDAVFLNEIDDNYIKNTEWCKKSIEADGANILYGPYLNENGRQVFSVCRLLNQSAKYTNIVKIEIYESDIYKFIKNEGANKKIFLVDDKNIIVSSTERNLIGTEINKLNYFSKIEFDKYTGFNELEEDNRNNIIFFDSLKGREELQNWKFISVNSSADLINNISEIVKNSLLICLACVFVTIFFVMLFSNTLTRKLTLLVRNVGKIRDGQFNIDINDSGNDEIAILSKSLKSMAHRIDYLINEVYIAEMSVKDIEIEKKQAEICALQSQMNPHFLFNTMESIRMDLWQKQEFEISEIIARFAMLLRKSIEWSDDSNTFKQEKQLVEDYLLIQKYRYVNKLDYIINIDTELENYSIPKFTLQPIVENAIYHGIELKKGKGCVIITAQIFEGDIKIIVQDDGLGMNEERLSTIRDTINKEQKKAAKARIGIRNVHQRLKLEFGNKYGLTITSQEGIGTQVDILLPMIDQNRGE